MTKGDLLNYLTDSLVRYKKRWVKQLVADSHMNNLTELYGLDRDKIWARDKKELQKLEKKIKLNIPEEVVDALLVDFINHVGAEQGIDYSLYTKHLKIHKPEWE